MVTIAVPYSDRMYTYPDTYYSSLVEALWACESPDFRTVKLKISELLHRTDYDAVFLIGSFTVNEKDLRYFAKNGTLIALWHDDLHIFKHCVPAASKPLARWFNIADIVFAPYMAQFGKWKLYRPFLGKTVWLPKSVPDWVLENGVAWESRQTKILLSGYCSRIYPLRAKLFRRVQANRLPSVEALNHPGYESSREKPRVIGEDYYRLMAAYKGAIATTATILMGLRRKIDYTVAKYFEIPACGCVPFVEETPDLERLGFVDGENCVHINRWNYEKKMSIIDSPEAEKIAVAARELIRTNHTHSIRVNKIISEIADRLK